MKKKTYAVIGLGQFGWSLAATLADADCEVIAIDRNEDKIREIAEKVSVAFVADVKEANALMGRGLEQVDVAVVSVSEDLEASVIAVEQCKEMGIPMVVAKAINSLHGRIMDKLGADEVIYPEQSMGVRVARNLMSSGLVDIFEMGEDISMAECRMPDSWEGKTLIELKVREKYKVNIVAIKRNENINIHVNPNEPLKRGCSIICVGMNRDLERLNKAK